MSISYSNVANPQYADSANKSVLVDVVWSTVGFSTRSLLSDAQTDAHIVALLAEVRAGQHGAIAAYVAPPPYVTPASVNKAKAVGLLAATDWVNQPDVYQGQAPTLTNRDAFLAYRQQLRQIAVNAADGDVNWPKKPDEQWSA